MNVPAEKVFGLAAVHELAHGFAAGVQALADLIERCPIGWRVADQNQRLERFKTRQALGQFGLAVFARSVERCRTRIAETRHMVSAYLQRLLVKVSEAELCAECRD